MSQLEIFKPEFNHKTRGHILTEKVWKELSIHEKINIRVHCSCEYLNLPNYQYMDFHFRYGTLQSPFVEYIWKQNSMTKSQPKNFISC
jgi:hypothetical protein